VGVVGLLPTRMPVPAPIEHRGRKLVLLGGLLPGSSDKLERRFGSSQFAKVILRTLWGLPPALDMDYEKRVQAATRQIALRSLAESVHDLSDGGLAVGLAECCFGPARLGARVSLDWREPYPAPYVLFHEAPSRVLLSVAPEHLKGVLDLAAGHRVEAPVIGETIEEVLSLQLNGKTLFESHVDSLYAAWSGVLGA
jgi:phosphoribosylformylglycinamidine synthase